MNDHLHERPMKEARGILPMQVRWVAFPGKSKFGEYMDTSCPQELSLIVLSDRYVWGQEKTAADIRHRVANALASVEPLRQRIKHEERFLWAMENGFNNFQTQ